MPNAGDLYSAAFVVVALVILVAPIAFLVIVGLAVLERRRSGRVGRRLTALLAASGGFALGAMLLIDVDFVIVLPVFGAIAALVLGLWRRQRRGQAGWLLTGAALPWTLLWGWYLTLALGGEDLDVEGTLARFGVGVAWLGLGLVLARRGDSRLPTPDSAAQPGQPGSRAFGSVAEAIRDAARIGPFPAPELAMLVAIVASLIVVPALVPPGLPRVVAFVVPILACVLVASEVYVRAWPGVSRQAFEAFSWLGEWELARARELTGERVPTSKRSAEAWLARRPERPEEISLRTEVLLLAGRTDEARRLVAEAPPAGTPTERFEVAALRDLVDWRAGGPGDLAAMESAAREIEPAEGDDRLRAEVSIAVARVRRLMAGPAPDGATAVGPLLEVRERLGARADGQIARALRRRIVPVLTITLVLFGLALELVSGRGLPIA